MSSYFPLLQLVAKSAYILHITHIVARSADLDTSLRKCYTGDNFDNNTCVDQLSNQMPGLSTRKVSSVVGEAYNKYM